MLGFCTFSATPARASFVDCNDPAYLGQFDARFATEPDFLCVESARVPVSSDAGTTHIRIVQHLVSDWATRPGAMRAFKDGVDASARKMGALGGFRISDVTILLVDGYAPGARKVNFGEIAAWTDVNPGDECRITVWLIGSGATARYGASVIAHELFHCVQHKNRGQSRLFDFLASGLPLARPRNQHQLPTTTTVCSTAGKKMCVAVQARHNTRATMPARARATSNDQAQ